MIMVEHGLPEESDAPVSASSKRRAGIQGTGFLCRELPYAILTNSHVMPYHASLVSAHFRFVHMLTEGDALYENVIHLRATADNCSAVKVKLHVGRSSFRSDDPPDLAIIQFRPDSDEGRTLKKLHDDCLIPEVLMHVSDKPDELTQELAAAEFRIPKPNERVAVVHFGSVTNEALQLRPQISMFGRVLKSQSELERAHSTKIAGQWRAASAASSSASSEQPAPVFTQPLSVLDQLSSILIEHSAYTAPGSSGAPLLDQHGDVIGIHFAGMDRSAGQSESYGVAVALNGRIRHLIKTMVTPALAEELPQLSKLMPEYQEAIRRGEIEELTPENDAKAAECKLEGIQVE